MVLDMIMNQGMDGLETYQRILDIKPEAEDHHSQRIFGNGSGKEGQELGAGVYVSKPYVLEKIGVAIRDELTKTLMMVSLIKVILAKVILAIA